MATRVMLKMQKIMILLSFMFILLSCQSQVAGNEMLEEESEQVSEPSLAVGAERVGQYRALLEGQRVGMVVNQTSVIAGVHLVDTFTQMDVNVVKVFAPEHGFRGDHSAGAIIQNGIDTKTGLPVVSLYGKNKKPSVDMLSDIDVVVFDIQDVGVRFYTYISTMHYVMEACAEQGKKVIVLDRPNPNGHYIDGPILDLKYKSFIGMHPIPIVHGLTVGELAQMINGEKWLKGGRTCDINIVPCLGYNHSLAYKLPIAPSPNLPNMKAVYAYPYLGLFEGTNVSIGRGTDYPFQLVGRPGEKNMSYSFTPRSIPGVSDNPKYLGKECQGEQVFGDETTLSEDNNKMNLHWLLHFYKTNGENNESYFKSFFYKLTGTESFKMQIEAGMTESEIRQTWQQELDEYKQMRKKYLLYP